MRYWPPSGVANSHLTASAVEVGWHDCGSASFSTYSPFSYSQSRRTDEMSSTLPGTALPSMSTAMAPISIGVPLSTNGRSVLRPTYRLDGCTSSVELALHCWRLTSVTEALADTF